MAQSTRDKAHLTAISRRTASAPARWLCDPKRGSEFIGDMWTHLDYGCGRGADADTFGWDRYDPHYFPELPTRNDYHTITCTFVLNVIESPVEREMILSIIRSLLRPGGKAYITIRRDVKTEGVTSRGTYQENVVLDLPVVTEKRGAYIIYLLKG